MTVKRIFFYDTWWHLQIKADHVIDHLFGLDGFEFKSYLAAVVRSMGLFCMNNDYCSVE